MERKKMVELLNKCRKIEAEIDEILIEELGEEDYRRLKKLILTMSLASQYASHNTLKGRENAYKKLTKLREEVRLWLGR